jgi:7-cyano-7-deazaguanine reductase
VPMVKPRLTILGSRISRFPQHPGEARLETIPFKTGAGKSTVTLFTDEFTSLCPVTGQPDFGEITIEYVPRKKIVESKSLKLYLFSFRNVGMFQEEIVNRILSDLKKALSPKYIKVSGKFKPRGGITLSPSSVCGK